MAQQHRQTSVQAKEESYDHHTHHPQQQQHHSQQPLSRPSSVVHQQQNPHQQHHSQPPPPQHPHQQPHPSSYPSAHPIYQQQQQASNGQHAQDLYSYQSSPYSTPAPNSGYSSADMMAATMPRPYPPISYHPQSANSQAAVASAPGHDHQQRSLYGQPSHQMHQQSMYYSQQPQYQSMPPAGASPYGPHPSQQHHHQSMASQPSMIMSHGAPSPVQHHMAHNGSQHSSASAMAGSPRHAKMELQSLTPQLSRQPAPPSAPSPLSMGQVQATQGMPSQGLQAPGMSGPQGVPQHSQHSQHPPQHSPHPQYPQHPQHPQHPTHASQHPQNAQHPQHPQHPSHPQQHPQHPGAPAQQNGSSPLPPPGQAGSTGPSVMNPNAAPGPIPATTPLVVRQDQNGVQWIAFEYSRDRVKMEYTIRCDVESVVTDDLSPDFKQENCVYPRACCPREQYRGNRLQYESECNTVGWALAELNPSLRGKRGLIQRAVDSWRNSNQDPRLRSRRVRRMAKMGSRKAAAAGSTVGSASPASHFSGPSPGTLPSAGGLSKPSPMHALPPQMHHHADPTAQTAGGDEVGEDQESPYSRKQREQSDHHHHHQPQQHGAVAGHKETLAFSSYDGYASGTPQYPLPPMVVASGSLSTASASASSAAKKAVPQPDGLFPDLAEAKKRKFVLVEDRGSRLRVRVTLHLVDTGEIPDSFRRSNAVCPASFFPREMESPPPSPTGRRFFPEDVEVDEDGGSGGSGGSSAGSVCSGSGNANSPPRRRKRRRQWQRRPGSSSSMTVSIPLGDGNAVELSIPRMSKTMRRKHVRLNDLGCRMAWLQSRAFAGRRLFLQKALDMYRNKTCTSIVAAMHDLSEVAPHYEMRVGKKMWRLCEQEMEMRKGEVSE